MEQIKTCRQCGAQAGPTASKCWLCGAGLDAAGGQPEIVTAELVQPARRAGIDTFFAGLFVLTIFLLILVGIGLGLQSIELGIGYGIAVTLPMIATGLILLSRKSRGQQVTWGDRMLTLVVSGAVTLGVLGLAGAAAIFALFIICLREL